MHVETIKEKSVYGFFVRTKNADEMNPESSKIQGLWNDFDAKLMDKVTDFPSIHGVYFNYESDMNGEFDVMAGSTKFLDTSKLEEVTIEAGKYLVFEAQGELPSIVISTWMQVWQYFIGNPEHERRYKTDFESYVAPDAVKIYIGIM